MEREILFMCRTEKFKSIYIWISKWNPQYLTIIVNKWINRRWIRQSKCLQSIYHLFIPSAQVQPTAQVPRHQMARQAQVEVEVFVQVVLVDVQARVECCSRTCGCISVLGWGASKGREPSPSFHPTASSSCSHTGSMRRTCVLPSGSRRSSSTTNTRASST